MAWNLRSRPPLAEPPAESPSTRNNSLILGFLLWAGASLPDKFFSILFLFLPFLASSRAFLAASRASLLFWAFSMIDRAISLFSSKKNWRLSYTMFSVAVLASGVPSLPLVWPSNCNNSSGTLRLITADSPSLTSEPSKTLSFPLTKLFCFA